MWLFAGLGNPGEDYARHRHNVGFQAMDAIAAQYGAVWKRKFSGLCAEISVGGKKAVLLKPRTYMNESGQSLGPCAKFYKIAPDHVVVFHDEIDLKPGEVRVKRGGGTAGHNGLKSVQAHLGTAEFWRVRIGVGHPGNRDQVSDYVLSNFSKADQKWLEPLVAALAESCESLISGDMKAYEQKAAAAVKPEGQ